MKRKTNLSRTSNTGCKFESLEDRQLMTAVPTELSQLALRYGRHTGTTYLYLNFDGGTIDDDQSGGSKTIAPYVAPAGQDRVQAIQDIIYRVSEIFSPFDVQVRIRRGAGNFSTSNGDSTIFIGDNTANTDGYGHNVNASSTPWDSSDHPGLTKGFGHRPNSDAYDLAFVDPVFFNFNNGTLTTESDAAVAKGIAHEAGHTFGLVHVLDGGAANDVMSYSGDSNDRFVNQTFGVTSLNYSSSGNYNEIKELPIVYSDTSVPTLIPTQDSFAYLRFALGDKEAGAYDGYRAGVADPSAVSADYYSFWQTPATITPASHPSATLGSTGEYDVYTLNNVSASRYTSVLASGPTRISLAVGTPGFDPQILLYDANGTNLLASTHGSSLQYTMSPGASYKLVISGYLGDSAGAYTVSMAQVSPLVFAPTTTIGTTTTTQPTTTTSLFSDTLLSSSISLLA
jgi:hypothetical protein